MSKVLKKQNKSNLSISCKECCRQMGDYIDNKLDINADVLFVEHVRGCKECREEFHNYYNFMTNLYFLNYGYNDKYPASEEFLLKDTEDIVLKYRKNKRRLSTIFITLLLLVLVLLSFIVIRHLGGIV